MQTSPFFRSICRLLAVAMLAAPLTPAMAGMVGTEQALTPATQTSHQSAVLSALSRADVTAQLQTLGVDPLAAKARVSTMTDAELASLAGQIDTLPAGAASNWVWAAVIAIAIWWYMKR